MERSKKQILENQVAIMEALSAKTGTEHFQKNINDTKALLKSDDKYENERD